MKQNFWVSCRDVTNGCSLRRNNFGLLSCRVPVIFPVFLSDLNNVFETLTLIKMFSSCKVFQERLPLGRLGSICLMTVTCCFFSGRDPICLVT